jgi:hypothetical protein
MPLRLSGMNHVVQAFMVVEAYAFPVVRLGSVFRKGIHEMGIAFADVILEPFVKIDIGTPYIFNNKLSLVNNSKSIVAYCPFTDIGINRFCVEGVRPLHVK